MGIRWREKDESKLKKIVRNFNAKIDRLKKKGYKEELLPTKKKLKEERQKIIESQNRKTFKKIERESSYFTQKGGEEIVKSSRGLELGKWEIKLNKYIVREITRERMKIKKSLEKIEKTDRGKKINKKNDKLESFKINQLRPKKFNFERMSKNDYEMYKKTLKEYDENLKEKNHNYRTNYYRALHRVLSPEQFKIMTKILKDVSDEDLVKNYYTSLNMDIDFIYEEINRNTIFIETVQAWNRVKGTKINKGIEDLEFNEEVEELE